MGKSELFSHFADRFEQKRTQAREFFDELNTLGDGDIEAADLFQHTTVLQQADLLAGARIDAPAPAIGPSTRTALLNRARRGDTE